MLTDSPCPKKLQITSQEDLLVIHHKVRALLNTLLIRTNLNDYTDLELHSYLSVVSDLSDQAISLLQQMIGSSCKPAEKNMYE